MDISFLFGAPGNISGYGTQPASQTQSKPFTIPIWGEDTSKTAVNAPKTTQADKSKAFEAIASGNFDFKSSNPFEDAKAGNFNLPAWIPTKTEPTRSDAEILKEMEELAKEHAKTGLFQDNDPRFLALMDEYVSSVSPDRAGIIGNSINEINERIATETYPEKLEDIVEREKKKNMIDFLLKALDKEKENNSDIMSNIAARGNNIAAGGNMYNVTSVKRDGDYASIELDYGGGKTTTLTYYKGERQPYLEMKGNTYNAFIDNGKVQNAFFSDENGEYIGHWNEDRGFGAIPLGTGAEFGRRKEMLGVYNAAYDFTYGRHNEPSVPSGNTLKGVNDYSSYAGTLREAYVSTYERLSNERLASGVA